MYIYPDNLKAAPMLFLWRLKDLAVTLGDDEVYISFWNSDDGYFLKPESEVFPEQKFDQTMGGI